MTFEARDSAAKVVPARYKPNTESSIKVPSTRTTSQMSSRTFQRFDSKRNTGCQTPGRSGGSYRLAPLGAGGELSPFNDPAERRAVTAAFVQFSRALMENAAYDRRSGRKYSEPALNRSPSAPNLAAEARLVIAPSPGSSGGSKRKPFKGCSKTKEIIGQRQIDAGGTLLSPHLLQRQALSMDNSFYDGYGCCTPPSPRLSRQHSGRSASSQQSLELELGASAGVSGSQASMALDLHECQVTLKVTDEAQMRRSDTAKKHQLQRQKQLEEERLSAARKSVDDSAIRTKTRPRVPGPRHQSMKIPGEGCIRVKEPKKKHEIERKIFCIEDHGQKTFPSERVKRNWEECRCNPHSESVILNHVLVRKNAQRRRSTPRSGTDDERSPRLTHRITRSHSVSPNHAVRYSRSPSPSGGRSPEPQDCAAVTKPDCT